VEQITEQLQQERQERLKRLGASDAASSEYPSAPPSTVDDDARSMASSFIHASQMAQSSLDASGSSSRPKRSKAQLWQDMKIHSITRALTLIYTLCLLTLLTRIQLNLLGRRTYLSSVVALASPPPVSQSTISLENKDDDNYDNVYGNDFETNRKYLTFSWWLLHRGSKRIMERVMVAVKEVFGGVNIREDISLERLADLIMQVRRKVEGETEEERRSMKWLEYLLPPKDEETFVIRQSGMSESDESPSPDHQMSDPIGEELINASLRRLLDETSDLIDSPTFSFVLTRLLDAGFSHLVDYRIATEAFKASGPAAPGFEARIVEIPDTKCKVAHVLPVFCKQAHTISAGSGELDAIAGVAAQETLGNEYLAAIDQVSDLGAFAAVIYSSNFEYELPEADAFPQTSSSRTANYASAETRSPELSLDYDDALDAAGNSLLEESDVLVLNQAQETLAPDVADGMPGSLEAAWQKATSPADGEDRTLAAVAEEAQLPVPVVEESFVREKPVEDSPPRHQ
jgi:peroxin-3